MASGSASQAETRTSEKELDRRHTARLEDVMAWEDAEQSATNREDWRRSVAQCV